MSTVHYLAFLAVATVFALVGVAQRSRSVHLSYDLHRLQREQASLADDNRLLACDIGRMTRPERTAAAIRSYGIDLVDRVAFAAPAERNGAAP
jgi:hypothetical protein